jgi:dihydrofolate reductase
MNISVYIATSLDGFIARTDGALDWLGDAPAEGGEDYGYSQFMDTIDMLVMGRNTFETVLGFSPWPYGSKPVVVLSSRPLDIPESLREHVEAMSGSPAEVVRSLSERGVEHVYLDGGKTIQRFLDAGLVWRLIITRIPILIGEGISLFGPLKHDLKLRHIATRVFPGGLVQSEYEIA